MPTESNSLKPFFTAWLLIGQMTEIHSFKACLLARLAEPKISVSNYLNHLVYKFYVSKSEN